MSDRTERLETARLVLEPLAVSHAAEMAPVLGEDELRLRARYARQVAGPGWHNWVLRLRDGGEAVGYVQATESGAEAELAWVLGAGHRGAGLATEAAAAVAVWLDRGIYAHVDPANVASQGVARRLGMTPGRARADGEIRWSRPR